ncbi:MAG TPA: NYN domain-containing protein [Nocardioidaceae bacterium]|nr:NYN domain-containing protein [Nocardioidaceae bacterium]
MSERAGADEPVAQTGPLPDAVRARVVQLAAEAVGRIATDALPPSLKKVASFAPPRRARLAGTQIAAVLETDEVFRGHVAVQVRALHEALADALDGGTAPPAADPVEVAAAAYLLRPEGWTDRIAEAAGAVGVEQATDQDRRATQQVLRLQRQLSEAASELDEARAKLRDQIATLKAENADLRRKLGETRVQLRAAEDTASQAVARAAEVTSQADQAAAQTDAEVRRLKSRIEQLERDTATTRRAERAGRDAELIRTRLLLDTLIDSAQGLRRELALPTVEGTPADQVVADVAEQGERTSSGHGSLPVDDPAMLDQLVQLPRTHLIVDGYNVTKTAWPGLPLEKQRDLLLSGLGPLAARSGAEITVVFDAAETKDRPLVKAPRGLRVLFSPVGVIADDVIRDLVSAEPRGRPLLVVTSDQAVWRDVSAAGARVVGSAGLSALISRGR